VLPSSEFVQGCQRSGQRLTVFAGDNGGFTGPPGLQTLASVVNAAWTSVRRAS
jgi:hypothetical protein